MAQMTDLNPGPGGIDTGTPNVARIYDYLLGGKDNFAADREAAQQLIAVIPDVAAIARDNRSFLGRGGAVSGPAGGIRQALDLGSGLPTQANVHELARGMAPDVRVVYVDNDPVVTSHGRAVLATRDRVTGNAHVEAGPGPRPRHPQEPNRPTPHRRDKQPARHRTLRHHR
jgi:hypothetical protein